MRGSCRLSTVATPRKDAAVPTQWTKASIAPFVCVRSPPRARSSLGCSRGC
jgi:hypothetical protein